MSDSEVVVHASGSKEFAALLRDYDTALGWVTDLATSVDKNAGDLDRPTPCGDWTVRLLLGHLIGTAHRGLATATGTSTTAAPHVVTDVPDAKLAATYKDLAGQVRAGWAAAPSPDVLVRAPWGECTARDAVQGFVVETLVHGWDLTTALHPERHEAQAPLPAQSAAARALRYVSVPLRLRGRTYGDPIEPAGGATALTALAAILGHQRP